RKVEKRQNYALIYGVILASLLRYLCHTIAGATVWAGLSIPSEAALLYSLSYNATYMIPETVVLISVCAYISSVVDFKSSIPKRTKKLEISGGEIYCTLGAGLLAVATVILDIALIFPHLQDPDNGEFVFTYLKNANFLLIGIITAAGILGSILLLICARKKKISNT
ncbi:MAG: energy-coupled thiamine transporter ThiT, partial [Clostridia bacterium]|nr:energy-coupled thiamine transporter ThiT [Clostridia bacterium]